MAGDEGRKGRLARFYLRARSSKFAIAAILGYVATLLALHIAYGFDPDLGDLNASLSIEASLGGSVLALMIEGLRSTVASFAAEQRCKNEQMLAMAEATRDSVAALQALLQASKEKE